MFYPVRSAAVALTLLVSAQLHADVNFLPRQHQVLPFAAPYVVELAGADLDADGRADVVFATYNAIAYNASTLSRLTVGINDGSGGFQLSDVIPPTGEMLNDFVLADFDGDGAPDLAYVTRVPSPNPTPINLAWMKGDGLGGFGLPQQLHQDPLSYAVELKSARIDADAVDDLVLVNISAPVGAPVVTQVTTYRHSGPGVLVADPADDLHSLLIDYGLLTSLGFCDTDRDGVLDLITTLGAHRGHGDGAFDAPVKAQLPQLPALPAIFDSFALDFDSDGACDLITSGYNHPARVFRGTGSGAWAYTALDPTNIVWATSQMKSVDFDLDGRLDVFPVGGNHYVFLEDERDRSTPITTIDASGAIELGRGFLSGGAVDAADLNADGRLDLIGVGQLAGQTTLMTRLSTTSPDVAPLNRTININVVPGEHVDFWLEPIDPDENSWIFYLASYPPGEFISYSQTGHIDAFMPNNGSGTKTYVFRAYQRMTLLGPYATVTVNYVFPAAPDAGGGGGGSLDPTLLMLLLAASARRLRRRLGSLG